MQQVAKFVEKITDQHYGWLKTYFYEVIDKWVRLYVENRKGEASPYSHFGMYARDIAQALSPLFKQSITREGKMDYVMVPDAEKQMAGWADGQAKAALKAYASKLDQKLTAIVGQKADFTINGSLKAHGGVLEGVITVTCSDNSSFDADTKMIINTSVHGKNFYQYPLLFRNVTMSDGTKLKKASEIQMLTTFLGNAELPKGTAAPKLSAGKLYDMLQAMLRALEAAGFEAKPGSKAYYWISWQGKNMGMVKVSGKGAYESKSGVSETDLGAFVKAMVARAIEQHGPKTETAESLRPIEEAVTISYSGILKWKKDYQTLSKAYTTAKYRDWDSADKDLKKISKAINIYETNLKQWLKEFFGIVYVDVTWKAGPKDGAGINHDIRIEAPHKDKEHAIYATRASKILRAYDAFMARFKRESHWVSLDWRFGGENQESTKAAVDSGSWDGLKHYGRDYGAQPPPYTPIDFFINNAVKEFGTNAAEQGEPRELDKVAEAFFGLLRDFVKQIAGDEKSKEAEFSGDRPDRVSYGGIDFINDIGTTSTFLDMIVRAVKPGIDRLKKFAPEVLYGEVAITDRAFAFKKKSGESAMANGLYRHWADTVDLIFGPISAGELGNVGYALVHELGHRYYYQFMDEGQRERYKDFFDKLRSSGVTAYSGENEAEDFAESFTHYVLGDGFMRDRDARDRFKAIMAGKRSFEATEAERDQITESALDSGMGVVAALEGSEIDQRLALLARDRGTTVDAIMAKHGVMGRRLASLRKRRFGGVEGYDEDGNKLESANSSSPFIESILGEGKQVGTLYHFTDAYSLIEILRKDTLAAGRNGTVSLTRDKNFLKARPKGNVGLSGDVHAALVIDGDKLSTRFAVEPFAANGYADEQEEVVEGDISGLRRFLKEVRIFAKRYDDQGIVDLAAIDDETGLGTDHAAKDFADWIRMDQDVKTAVV